MISPIITATWQAGALSALSNVLGQAIQAYQANVITIVDYFFDASIDNSQQKPFSLNTTDLIHFVLFANCSTPPNVIWQEYLERKFPAYTTKPQSTPNKKTDDGPVRLILAHSLIAGLTDFSISPPRH
jgi:hypothetical protein